MRPHDRDPKDVGHGIARGQRPGGVNPAFLTREERIEARKEYAVLRKAEREARARPTPLKKPTVNPNHPQKERILAARQRQSS